MQRLLPLKKERIRYESIEEIGSMLRDVDTVYFYDYLVGLHLVQMG